MAKKQYHIELVQKELPYICMGFVKETSIQSNKLEFTLKSKDALVVEDKETLRKAMDLIAEFRKDRNNVYVMEWITEINSKKRVFLRDVTF